MSNGSPGLDDSASALFAYAAPEIEQSKALFEDLCRTFDGNDMQGQDDQMLLFEKLSAGLFEDMIVRGLCMHAFVRWKRDEQQLKAERRNISVHVEQERLFQKQVTDDVFEKGRLQQSNMGLNAQLQQAKLELRQVEEARDELASQLREAQLVIIGMEGEQRRQKSSTPSPVKEQVEGHEASFWRAPRGEAEESHGELGGNKARRATILL